MSIIIQVKGRLRLEGTYVFEDVQEAFKEAQARLRVVGIYLELDDVQRHADDSWVMLVDPTGEIPTEGPAQVCLAGYQGCGMYTVCIPGRFRTDPTDDVDGLREVHEDQMVPCPAPDL